MHARLSAVVRVLNVVEYPPCIAAVSGNEGLVPHRIQERVGIWSSVLEEN